MATFFQPPADPVKSMERIYERMNEAEAAIARYEAHGFTYCAKAERRRLAGLRSAKTRLLRTYFA